MTTTLLTARRLITADATVDYPRIAILGDGTIASIESGERSADDTTLTAAFFDVHVHGAAGHDSMEGTVEARLTSADFLPPRVLQIISPPPSPLR